MSLKGGRKMLNLAINITKLSEEYDSYSFNDACDNFDDAVNDTLELLNTKDEGIYEFLDEVIENDDEMKTQAIALKNEVQQLYKGGQLCA